MVNLTKCVRVLMRSFTKFLHHEAADGSISNIGVGPGIIFITSMSVYQSSFVTSLPACREI